MPGEVGQGAMRRRVDVAGCSPVQQQTGQTAAVAGTGDDIGKSVGACGRRRGSTDSKDRDPQMDGIEIRSAFESADALALVTIKADGLPIRLRASAWKIV